MNHKLMHGDCKLYLQAILYIYSIWMERNFRLHTNVAQSPSVLIHEIQQTLRAQLAGLNHVPTSPQFQNTHQDTYLTTWFALFQSPITASSTASNDAKADMHIKS
ncbi:hypothetical protein V5N11_018015 [Cardamine amara subsp. amara]|uniref:Uncharacterized protein n=1 Tax=Cardamine amara subsp. amara TaxID=228776 RepID=A0ABD1B4E9_CARAN